MKKPHGNSKYHKILTKEFLYKEYIVNKKSIDRIIKETRYSSCAIVKYMKIHEIHSRTRSNAAKIGAKINPNYKNGISRKKHFCIDCGKEINYRNKRCYKCHKKSRKTILICDYCNKSFAKYNCWIRKTPAKNNFCSRKCHSNWSSENIKGKNHPMFGKKSPMYGKKAPHGKGSYYKQSWMRSSWEIAYAKYCIINHIKYRYEPKVFEITYKYEGIKKEGTYRPDFYLPEQDLWIEIKGWWRDDAEKKFKAFKKQYKDIKIKVLTKKELKVLKIL